MTKLERQIAELGDRLADNIVDAINSETRRILEQLLENLTEDPEGVTADWMNEVQEQIADVIEQAGDVLEPPPALTAAETRAGEEPPRDMDGNEPAWLDRARERARARRESTAAK